MTTLAFHALAPTFAHTQDVSYDVRVQPTDTGNGDFATIPTGNYRMCLAPTAGSVRDFLRVMQSAINAALTLDGSAVTLALTISAAGIVTMTFSGPIDSAEFVGDVWRRLGLASTSPTPTLGGTVIVGVRPVWHLAILTAATGPYWQPAQAGGIGRTTGGRVYAVAASLTSWSRSLDVSMQPTLPVDRITRACEASAFYPAPEYMDALGSTATAREWSVLDVIYSARNASCGYASGTWQTIRTSTSERFWIAYVGPATLLATASTPIKAAWLAYALWTLELVAPVASPTGTRA